MTRRLRSPRWLRWLAARSAEVALTLAIVAGWALLTWGVALVTDGRAWPFSAGLLFLSGSGWRLLYTVARDGLYALTRTDRRPDSHG